MFSAILLLIQLQLQQQLLKWKPQLLYIANHFLNSLFKFLLFIIFCWGIGLYCTIWFDDLGQYIKNPCCSLCMCMWVSLALIFLLLLLLYSHFFIIVCWWCCLLFLVRFSLFFKGLVWFLQTIKFVGYIHIYILYLFSYPYNIVRFFLSFLIFGYQSIG